MDDPNQNQTPASPDPSQGGPVGDQGQQPATPGWTPPGAPAEPPVSEPVPTEPSAPTPGPAEPEQPVPPAGEETPPPAPGTDTNQVG